MASKFREETAKPLKMNVWLNAYKRLCYANVFTCSFGNHKYFMVRKQLVDLIFSLGKNSWVRALIAEKSELVIYQTRSHSQRNLKIRVIKKKPFQNSYNKITFAAECDYILICLICSLVGLQKEGTHAHVKDSQPSWQVCPSGDPAPGAGAMTISLAYREGVIFPYWGTQMRFLEPWAFWFRSMLPAQCCYSGLCTV